MARLRKEQGCGGVGSVRLLACCAWACVLLSATTAEAHADVDTSTGLGDNTLTNSGKCRLTINFNFSVPFVIRSKQKFDRLFFKNLILLVKNTKECGAYELSGSETIIIYILRFSRLLRQWWAATKQNNTFLTVTLYIYIIK